jgi:hypothetical protein
MNFLWLVGQRLMAFLQRVEHTEIRTEVVDLHDFHAVTRVIREYLTFVCIDQTA